MSYHDLSECTLTDDERIAEKDRILRKLLDRVELKDLTEPERRFIWNMDGVRSVTVKQLFYLRDLNAKY